MLRAERIEALKQAAKERILILDGSWGVMIQRRGLEEADYLPTWHGQREGGALGPEEQAAALGAAVHAQTPTVTHIDPLGRAFLTVAQRPYSCIAWTWSSICSRAPSATTAWPSWCTSSIRRSACSRV